MSIQAVAWVERHSPLKGEAFLVHLCLADSASQEGSRVIDIPALATKARVSEEMVRATISHLVKQELLWIRMNPHEPIALAQLLFPELPPTYDASVVGFTPIDAPPIAREPPPTAKQVITASLRKMVFERDAYRCRGCEGWEDLSIDHIQPESLGGPTTLDNLQTLCRPCNSRKGARTP